MQILAVNIVIALFAMFVTWLPWVMYFKEFISFNNLLAMPAGVMLWLCWSGVLHTDRRDPDIPGWLMSIALVFSLPFYRRRELLEGPELGVLVGPDPVVVGHSGERDTPERGSTAPLGDDGLRAHDNKTPALGPCDRTGHVHLPSSRVTAIGDGELASLKVRRGN